MRKAKTNHFVHRRTIAPPLLLLLSAQPALLSQDIISHFILRLAYCRTEELRRWYLTQVTQFLMLSSIPCPTLKRVNTACFRRKPISPAHPPQECAIFRHRFSKLLSTQRVRPHKDTAW